MGGRGQGCGSPGEKGAGGVRETGEERAASAREIEKCKLSLFVTAYIQRNCLHTKNIHTAYIQRMYIPLTYKETNPTTFFDFYLTFSEA